MAYRQCKRIYNKDMVMVIIQLYRLYSYKKSVGELILLRRKIGTSDHKSLKLTIENIPNTKKYVTHVFNKQYANSLVVD